MRRVSPGVHQRDRAPADAVRRGPAQDVSRDLLTQRLHLRTVRADAARDFGDALVEQVG